MEERILIQSEYDITYSALYLGLAKLMMLFVGEPGIIRQTQNGNVDLISIEAMFGVDPTPTWKRQADDPTFDITIFAK